MHYLLVFMFIAFSDNLSASPVHSQHMIFENEAECHLVAQHINTFRDSESRGVTVIDCMKVSGEVK